MALKTRSEYLASLKALRPNIYKFGELIEDVTTNPVTKRVVESHARAYDAANDPSQADMFTTTSALTGEKIHRHNSLMQSMEEVITNSKFKREMYRVTGSCTGALCAGWNGMNTMWAVTHEIDQEHGTNYHERLKNWALTAESKGLAVAGALTDAKGDRSLKASKQPNPDANLRVAEVRDDGIVLRGAKLMICGTAACNELFLLPGTAYGETEKEYSVACVVPRDIDGLTIIETRRPSDTREQEEGFDIPTDTGITQAYLLFEDVFVPNERVFLCGEYPYTGKVIQFFTGIYRACIGACVAGQGDVMIGAGMLMARANGLSAKTFSSKFVEMAVNNETTFAMGVGAIALGGKHPSGVWIPDALTSHANKIHVATLPYETKTALPGNRRRHRGNRVSSFVQGLHGFALRRIDPEVHQGRKLQRRSESEGSETHRMADARSGRTRLHARRRIAGRRKARGPGSVQDGKLCRYGQKARRYRRGRSRTREVGMISL